MPYRHNGATCRLGIVSEVIEIENAEGKGLSARRTDFCPVMAQKGLESGIPCIAAAGPQTAQHDGKAQAALLAMVLDAPKRRRDAPAPGTHRITDIDERALGLGRVVDAGRIVQGRRGANSGSGVA